MCPGEISLVVCDDAFISELNRAYRKKNRATDVLSFSMRDVVSGDSSDPVLGDIIISVQTAEVQAREEGTTIEEEFKFLFTHGLLHLLGYTHDQRDDEKLMMGMTKEILAGIKGNT
jgi:probable rRNA maturation factor